MKYVLGVDGGNTKTDYILFDEFGNFVDGHRSGTCSHEALKDSFSGTYRVMKEEVEKLLSRNNLTVQDVSGAAFGLAGADVLSQKKELNRVIREIGFTNFEMDNDGFLGLKAASLTGYGVCSINGTGTVSVGIDELGNHIQVGGVGYISGDEAGGAYLTRRTMQAVYDELYRAGNPTSLTKNIFDYLGIDKKEDFLSVIIEKTTNRTLNRTDVIKTLFKEANAGDKVAIDILETAGRCMGLSIAGCILNSTFNHPVPVILAGSVWANATAPFMFDAFKNVIIEKTGKECEFIILKTAPACGAIIWALEVANNEVPNPELRQIIIDQVTAYQETQQQTK